MPLETNTDLQSYMDAFGTTAIVSGKTITAIFDNEYADLLDVSTSTPTLICVSTDVADVQYGDSVSVASASFIGTIRVVMTDGYGMTTLLLGRS